MSWHENIFLDEDPLIWDSNMDKNIKSVKFTCGYCGVLTACRSCLRTDFVDKLRGL